MFWPQSIVRAAATAVFLAAFAGAGLAAGGVFRTFGKWAVGCDNGLACAAFGAPEEETGTERVGLRIARGAGAEAKITIELGSKDISEEESVHIDGKLALIESRIAGGADASPNDPVLGVIGRMLNARTLSLTAEPDKSDLISLNGLKAALLFMDEAQGRTGARNAFVAKGDAKGKVAKGKVAKDKAAKAPAAYPLLRQMRTPAQKSSAPDTLSAAETKALVAFYRKNPKDSHCDFAPAELAGRIGGGFLLGGGMKLAEVYCWRAAYQAGSIFYLLSAGSVREALFERLDTKTGALPLEGGISVTSADFSEGRLSGMHKGRGVGGCGEQTSWLWDGRVFRLASQTLKINCGFQNATFHLYRARVRGADGKVAPAAKDGDDEVGDF